MKNRAKRTNRTEAPTSLPRLLAVGLLSAFAVALVARPANATFTYRDDAGQLHISDQVPMQYRQQPKPVAKKEEPRATSLLAPPARTGHGMAVLEVAMDKQSASPASLVAEQSTTPDTLLAKYLPQAVAFTALLSILGLSGVVLKGRRPSGELGRRSKP